MILGLKTKLSIFLEDSLFFSFLAFYYN